jgi:teichoic acid transport system permease protein
MINQFITDLKRYTEYMLFAAKSELKDEVAGSYLGMIWWILDPLFFMLVYTFVVRFIFIRGGDDFPVFVFVGLTAWNFMNNTVLSAVTIIKSFRSIITKVYLPKFILILIRIYKNLFKMGISFILVFILMYFFQIKYSWMMLLILPIILLNILLTFAISVFVAHIGVFVNDFANIVNVILRFLFYTSGILFAIKDRIPDAVQPTIFLVDPIAYIIDAYRDVIMYQHLPNLFYFLYWFVLGLVGSYFALIVMYRYENTYVKVVQNG